MRFFKSRKKPAAKSNRFKFLGKLKPGLPKYVRESITELKKVTWPTRKEAWRMTLAVFVFSAIFALIVVISDFGLQIAAEELFL